jgi:catechol 2,3-dioxygenase-like lactoylglutathione lyase family enzyme
MGMKITAVLIVESIEKSLPFWIDRIGFEKTVEVPEDNSLGFVILVRDGAELMLQTIESVRNDVPQLAPKSFSHDVGLFIEIDDFDDIVKRLNGYPIALPERTTFYGTREIGVREPNGHTVIFAARVS